MALLTREQVQSSSSGDTAAPDDPNGKLIEIPEGVAGIAATLDFMVHLTKEYRTNFAIRTLAEQIVASVPAKDYYGELHAIQNWVRANVRYTDDVNGIEMVKNPYLTAVTHSGDCDDMALLAGTLINSLGKPVRYVAIGSSEPGIFEHVYVEAKVNRDRWIAVETTEPVNLGWQPEPQLARMVRHV